MAATFWSCSFDSFRDELVRSSAGSGFQSGRKGAGKLLFKRGSELGLSVPTTTMTTTAASVTSVPGPNRRVFLLQPQSALPQEPLGLANAFLKMVETSLNLS